MLAGPLARVPLVDLGLHRVALGQQRGLTRGEVADHVGKSGPERVGADTGARKGLRHEVMQYGGDP